MTTPFPLGRNLNHDPRSRRFPFRADPAAGPLVSVRHHRLIPVFDQGSLGSCTGNAAVGCLGHLPFHSTLPQGTRPLDQAFAVDVYSQASAIDPFVGQWPPTDTGSDGLSVAKVLHKLGLVSGYRHAFTFDDALAALSAQPVLVGTVWYSSMFYPDRNGIVSVTPTARRQGGHEYLLDEIDMERGLVGATNSWGASWGQGGRFYMTFDTLRRLLSEYGDATVLVPLSAPAPEPEPEPIPVPEPVPGPDAADTELWEAVSVWALASGWRSRLRSRRVGKALRRWGRAKGFTTLPEDRSQP